MPHLSHRFLRLFGAGDARNAPSPLRGEFAGLIDREPHLPGKPEITWTLVLGEYVFGVNTTNPYVVESWVWYRDESAN